MNQDGGFEREAHLDVAALISQSKRALDAVETDQDAYRFIATYLSRDLQGRYITIYRSERHEMLRSPRQALANLLSLPPLE